MKQQLRPRRNSKLNLEYLLRKINLQMILKSIFRICVILNHLEKLLPRTLPAMLQNINKLNKKLMMRSREILTFIIVNHSISIVKYYDNSALPHLQQGRIENIYTIESLAVSYTLQIRKLGLRLMEAQMSEKDRLNSGKLQMIQMILTISRKYKRKSEIKTPQIST